MLGIVYRIICLIDPAINYIGSTSSPLRFRWQEHKKDYKKWKGENRGKSGCSIYKYFELYGIEKFKILPIKEYEVIDRFHLRAYEQLWINRTNCVNSLSAFAIKKLTKRKYGKLEEICSCGATYLKNNSSRHKQSKKHCKWEISRN